MVNIRIFSVILVLTAAVGCGNNAVEKVPLEDNTQTKQEAEETMASVADLKGYWFDEMHKGKTRFFEHWEPDGQGGYEGLGFVMSGKDTVFIEELRLKNGADGWTYSARISSQNDGEWINFKQRPSGKQTLMFVNPDHDFPQTIRYVHDALDRWKVSVSGIENDLPREESFILVPRKDI